MEEKTADEIAAIFTAAGDSVTVIGTAQTSDETDDEFKNKIKRNVEHLEIIKDYKKLDETTSIWTSERNSLWRIENVRNTILSRNNQKDGCLIWYDI